MTTNDTPAEIAPRSLRAGAELELGFNDLLANGQAVGRSAGVVVFCFGPLPQERARVRITGVKPKYAVAEMLQLTRRSPFRAQPFCPVFGTCGGCQVQHLSYPAQLGWKRDVVKNALARIGGLGDVDVREAIGMINPRHYRNKMSLVVDQRGGSRLGFYQQRSHDLVPIAGCPVVMPALNTLIAGLDAARSVPAAGPAFAQARHIVARTSKAAEQTVVTFTTAQPSDAVIAGAPAILKAAPGVVGVTNSYDLSGANAVMGRKHRIAAGSAEIDERISGVRYRVSAGSFFQVNVEIVARIFEFMRPGLDVPREIVDLYCGAGTFALFFAQQGSRVLGVEESAQAVREARENAKLNQLEDRIEFHAGRVEQAVNGREIAQRLREAQIAFLDPPRKGSDETTLRALVTSGVPNVWYLSCDPATLARDLKFMRANGYALGVVQPFDMFPHTGHVETLVTLYRESAMQQQIIREAFKNTQPPAWPADAFPAQALSPEEYPDFVER